MGFLRWPGGWPGRSGDLNFGAFAASRLTRQRARRRAWRGRSSRASLRACTLRVRRAALIRPSGGGETGGRRARTLATGRPPWNRARRNGYVVDFAYFTRRLRSSGKNMRLSQSLKAGGRPAALPDPVPRGMGRDARHLHHKAPGRHDNQAPHGGFRRAAAPAARRGGDGAESAPLSSFHQAPAWRTGLQRCP